MSFFRDSKIETYMRMWNTMAKSEPTVFVNNTKEGKTVERGKGVVSGGMEWGLPHWGVGGRVLGVSC